MWFKMASFTRFRHNNATRFVMYNMYMIFDAAIATREAGQASESIGIVKLRQI